MPSTKQENIQYVPPKIHVVELTEVMELLSPAISCSGFNQGEY